MEFRSKLSNIEQSKDLPLEVYASVVKSLYADRAALFVGAFSTFVAAAILYARTSDIIHLLFAIALCVVSAVRILDVKKYIHKSKTIEKSRRKLKIWEHRYLVLGSVHVGLLGFWCFMVSARSNDDFVLLMTVSIMLANLIGITGRNFGSDIVVSAQLISAGIPLVLGSFIFGDIYHLMLGVFLIPFFLGIKLMAGRLRNILLDATITANENKLIANRFDVAVNNISHGMAMIDETQKFVVVNAKFAELAGAGNEVLINRNIDEVCNSNAAASENSDCKIFSKISDTIDNRASRKSTYLLQDNRTIEHNYYPMEKGGVVLLEDISARVAAEAEIKELARFDPLTNLPNRSFFIKEIDKHLTKDGVLAPCSLYFIDLDKFKEINDTLGHTTGDKLLVTVAQRLKSVMDQKSIICRFGGDEFVIIVPGLIDRKECGKFAERLVDEAAKPLLLDGHRIMVGATVGISLCPDNAVDIEQLLRFSDAALYLSKSEARGSYRFYSQELGQMISDRRQLEMDMRLAIEKDQFTINYQPLVNLAENKILTCEALLRWHHPEKGLIGPDKFIPIAEETGFIVELGEYVLEQAAKQCLRWPAHMRVAVNVSSVQFTQSDMVKTVCDVLKRTGLAPHRLEIEVTESLKLDNLEETVVVLSQISKLGVKISLDDFGTGYSSLSYLHMLPLDKVKMDRSFIKNIDKDDKSILLLEGVSKLSHSLGLKIVVEGVETIEQLKLLQNRVHVDEVQGYLFGKAMPAEDLAALIDGNLSLYASERLDEKVA